MNRMSNLILLASAILALAGNAGAQEMGVPAKGAQVARMVCAECHAVAPGDARSPNRNAPSFSTVAASGGMTSTALRVWLQTPHPTMPNIQLNAEDKSDVIAYILSLKRGG